MEHLGLVFGDPLFNLDKVKLYANIDNSQLTSDFFTFHDADHGYATRLENGRLLPTETN